jgi:hypothetical protein
VIAAAPPKRSGLLAGKTDMTTAMIAQNAPIQR